MSPEARDLIRAIMESPERAADIPPAAVPALLAALAGVQLALAARLAASGNGHAETPKAPAEPDKLLTVEAAAELFAVERRWLYRHAAQIPGARKLSRKCLRFTEAGLRRYLAAKRA